MLNNLSGAGPKTEKEAVHLHTFKAITAGILNCYTVEINKFPPTRKRNIEICSIYV